jgi:hypothetical protein
VQVRSDLLSGTFAVFARRNPDDDRAEAFALDFDRFLARGARGGGAVCEGAAQRERADGKQEKNPFHLSILSVGGSSTSGLWYPTGTTEIVEL